MYIYYSSLLGFMLSSDSGPYITVFLLYLKAGHVVDIYLASIYNPVYKRYRFLYTFIRLAWLGASILVRVSLSEFGFYIITPRFIFFIDRATGYHNHMA